MKKNKIYTLVTSLIVFISISACKNALDINPANNINTANAFKTSGDVVGALVGTYYLAANHYAFGGDNLIEPDFLADNGDLFYYDSFIEFTELINKSVATTNAYVYNTWGFNYATINNANTVLSQLSLVDTTGGTNLRVKGEAEFLRALSYFELVRLFGIAYTQGDPTVNLGVPLILKPTLAVSDSNKVARNTVSEVYAQVIKDLTDACNVLPAPKQNSYFADKGAAQALLARVYLNQGNYKLAATYADSVISSGAYSLTPTVMQEFPSETNPMNIPNSSEDIFAIQVSAGASKSSIFNQNDLNTWYASGDFLGRGKTNVTTQFLAKFLKGDDRLNLVYTESSSGNTFNGKNDNEFGNVVLIRLAEMYFIRAESNFQQSTSIGDKPLNDLNVINKRSKLPNLSAANLNLTEILNEKYLELCFEGETLFDRKRNNMVVDMVDYNDPTFLLPIPSTELEANPKLVQNAGY